MSFKIVGNDCKSKGILNYIHSDVWGPSPVFLTFMDEFSRKVWVYFIKHKHEVFDKFKEWKAKVENQTSRKVKYLRSNNRGEYKNHNFYNSARMKASHGTLQFQRLLNKTSFRKNKQNSFGKSKEHETSCRVE